MYKKQAVVDYIIKKFAEDLEIPRESLNVIAAGKGLAFGDLKINGRTIGGDSCAEIIPTRESITSLESSAQFVLVIEKDAVMNVIIQYYEEISRKCGSFILVCGKGFPCRRTKQFLNLLASEFPHIPHYAIVDNDPYGISIAFNYKTGGKVRE